MGVLSRRRQIVSRGSVGGLLGLVEQSLLKRSAPAAARAGAKAFGQLTDPARTFDANEVLDLPPTHMEAEAEFVVEFHLGTLLKDGDEPRRHEDTKESTKSVLKAKANCAC